MVKAARKLLVNYWANSLVKAGSESGSVIRNYSSCISVSVTFFFFLRQESFLSSKLIYSCCFMLNWSQKTLRCTITVSWGDSYVVILSSSDKGQKFLRFEFEQNCFQTLIFYFFPVLHEASTVLLCCSWRDMPTTEYSEGTDNRKRFKLHEYLFIPIDVVKLTDISHFILSHQVVPQN